MHLLFWKLLPYSGDLSEAWKIASGYPEANRDEQLAAPTAALAMTMPTISPVIRHFADAERLAETALDSQVLAQADGLDERRPR